MELTATDKIIINHLQGNFPLDESPWEAVAELTGIEIDTLIERIQTLQDEGYISRFGPLYDAQKMGGGLSLAAMQVDKSDYESVTEIVNQFEEVAHNYEREHKLNMWFVIATEKPEQVFEVIEKIETASGYSVYNMPKQKEYFLGLQLKV